MDCPNCNSKLIPWIAPLHGVRGIECETCPEYWWSDEVSTSYPVKEALQLHIADLPFPDDAQTSDQRARRWQRLMQGGQQRKNDIRKEQK